jgi:hypothetical protein
MASSIICLCRELADMLMDSGHTLLTILGDILDFSKIDAHAMTLQTQLVDLRSPMEASLQMVSAGTALVSLALHDFMGLHGGRTQVAVTVASAAAAGAERWMDLIRSIFRVYPQCVCRLQRMQSAKGCSWRTACILTWPPAASWATRCGYVRSGLSRAPHTIKSSERC